MKILILSDIHGNWAALQAVLAAEPDVGQILCLGDLVNYGPQPAECVAWAMKTLTPDWLIQGNHDHAVALDEDPCASVPYKTLAAATQELSKSALAPEAKQFLAGLQPLQRFKLNDAICVACHAVPSEPLYEYFSQNSPVTLWESELSGVNYPDFLFVGHTHLPTKTRIRRTLVVNPGSVGQPKDGDPRAAYAIWEDGEVSLRRAEYDVEKTIRAYRGTGLEPHSVEVLAEVLRTGGYFPLDQTIHERLRTYMQTNPDHLGAMFFLRQELTQREGHDLRRLTEAERSQWLLNYARALAQQAARLTDLGPWRWWTASQKFNQTRARAELIELLHQAVALAQVLGMDADEVFGAFVKQHGASGTVAAPTSANPVKDPVQHPE
jgi:predicted phosphodiesterase